MMAARPTMQTKNSSGERVSLLNDDSGMSPEIPTPRVFQYPDPTSMARSYSNTSGASTDAPRTPGLFRADSYDSQATADPVSPATPLTEFGPSRPMSYTSAGYSKGPVPQNEERPYEYPPPASEYHPQYPPSQPYSMQGNTFQDNHPQSEEQYDDDAYGSHERGAKRYPCRFRESHHCDKTFTTSGHASRHSKIHTAEKAVQCTFPGGCSKKFTRGDNMKQHLETHYKNKAKTLTQNAGVRKSTTTPSRTSRPSSRNLGQADFSTYDPALFTAGNRNSQSLATSSASPVAQYESLDTNNVRAGPLMPRSLAPETERSFGLDVLANAAMAQ